MRKLSDELNTGDYYRTTLKIFCIIQLSIALRINEETIAAAAAVRMLNELTNRADNGRDNVGRPSPPYMEMDDIEKGGTISQLGRDHFIE